MGSTSGSSGETTVEVPQGTFELHRYPVRQNEQLRAWDAADEYLLSHISEAGLIPQTPTALGVLVVNDAFGALGTALAPSGLTWWSDSLLSHTALTKNLQVNDVADPVKTLPSTEQLEGTFDLVILKVPKSNSFLEDQLMRLRSVLHQDTVILAAGMVKHIHTSTLEIFERVLGPTHTSLAKKKARLIHTKFDPTLAPEPVPWPTTWKHNGLSIFNHPGVFAASKLDVGTRFLLDNLPTVLPESAPDSGSRIVDLGCGNGVVGTVAASIHPKANLTFVDESHMAIASAEATFGSAFPDRPAQFAVATGLTKAVTGSNPVDLVITNPPFHQNQQVSDVVAWEMFKDANRCLAQEGEILVVGNRHLGYHVKLKRLFGNCDTVKGNRKFVVLRSRKTRT